MYATKDGCIEIIKDIYDNKHIKVYPAMKLVDTLKVTLDDVLALGK